MDISTSTQSIMERHPAWGYTESVQKDDKKAKIILTQAQNLLTTARSSIKKIVSGSSTFRLPD